MKPEPEPQPRAWLPVHQNRELRHRRASALLHRAMQWPARFARVLVTPVPDDSHESLTWSSGQRCFWSSRSDGGFRLGVSIEDPQLLLFKDERIVSALVLEGQTDDAVAEQLDDELRRFHLPVVAHSAPEPYTLPTSSLYRFKTYKTAQILDELRQLARLYANTEVLLDGAARLYDDLSLGLSFKPSPPRLWPHHFDFAIFAEVISSDPDESRGIGLGLAPADAISREDYFYSYPWPRNNLPRSIKFPKPFRYNAKAFGGAVLPVGKVFQQPDPSDVVRDFFRTSVHIWADHLSS